MIIFKLNFMKNNYPKNLTSIANQEEWSMEMTITLINYS